MATISTQSGWLFTCNYSCYLIFTQAACSLRLASFIFKNLCTHLLWAFLQPAAAGVIHCLQLLASFLPVLTAKRISPNHQQRFSALGSGPSCHTTFDCNQHPVYSEEQTCDDGEEQNYGEEQN